MRIPKMFNGCFDHTYQLEAFKKVASDVQGKIYFKNRDTSVYAKIPLVDMNDSNLFVLSQEIIKQPEKNQPTREVSALISGRHLMKFKVECEGKVLGQFDHVKVAKCISKQDTFNSSSTSITILEKRFRTNSSTHSTQDHG